MRSGPPDAERLFRGSTRAVDTSASPEERSCGPPGTDDRSVRRSSLRHRRRPHPRERRNRQPSGLRRRPGGIRLLQLRPRHPRDQSGLRRSLSYPASASPDFYVSGFDGEGELGGTAAITDEPVGLGRAVLFSSDPNFRAYTAGMQKVLWNALFADPWAAPAAKAGSSLRRRLEQKAIVAAPGRDRGPASPGSGSRCALEALSEPGGSSRGSARATASSVERPDLVPDRQSERRGKQARTASRASRPPVRSPRHRHGIVVTPSQKPLAGSSYFVRVAS